MSTSWQGDGETAAPMKLGWHDVPNLQLQAMKMTSDWAAWLSNYVHGIVFNRRWTHRGYIKTSKLVKTSALAIKSHHE